MRKACLSANSIRGRLECFEDSGVGRTSTTASHSVVEGYTSLIVTSGLYVRGGKKTSLTQKQSKIYIDYVAL